MDIQELLDNTYAVFPSAAKWRSNFQESEEMVDSTFPMLTNLNISDFLFYIKIQFRDGKYRFVVHKLTEIGFD